MARTRCICSCRLGKQIGPAVETKAPGQSLERFPIFRDGVGLLFGLDLETMFDPPQEPISGLEFARVFVRQKFQLGQAADRLERAGLLQKRMTRRVQ